MAQHVGTDSALLAPRWHVGLVRPAVIIRTESVACGSRRDKLRFKRSKRIAWPPACSDIQTGFLR